MDITKKLIEDGAPFLAQLDVENTGVEVYSDLNLPVERFPNMAAARKSYPNLDPYRNSPNFTWAMRGQDHATGETLLHFESWPVYKAMSESKKLREDGTNDLNPSATSGAYPSVGYPRLQGTLQQWCNKYGITFAPYGREGALYVSASGNFALIAEGMAMWDLFHLTDYAVSSSVSGPGYVLVPRHTESKLSEEKKPCIDCYGSSPKDADPNCTLCHGTGQVDYGKDDGAKGWARKHDKTPKKEAKLHEDGPWGPGMGVGGWPLGPSPHFPNEQSVHCPKCDSSDVVMTGTSLRPEVTGYLCYNACNSCGYMTFYDEKRREVVHSTYKGKQEGKMDKITKKLVEAYLDPHDPRPPVSAPEKLGTCKQCGFEGLVRSGLCLDCASKKESKSRIRETGEMGRDSIQPGGENYEWAQVIRRAAEEICSGVPGCSFQEMRPFDVYQGPYAVISTPKGTGKVWDSNGFEAYLEFNGTTSNVENGRGWQGSPEECAAWLSGQLGHNG